MTITITDIAAHAGVSKTTVSRVLNGRPDVDQETAERVRAAMETLGYVPNARATALARGRANCIGVLVPSMTWSVMLDMLCGVAEEVEPSSYAVMLYSMTRGDESIQSFMREVIRAKQIDGLAVLLPLGMLPYLNDLYEQGLPIVLIDDRSYNPSFPSVATTNRAGGYAATRHLLELGRHRIAYINGPVDFGCNQERLAGYHQALAEADVTPQPKLIVDSDYTEAGGVRCTNALLNAGIAFDAIFAANDLMAFGAMQALKRAGRRIPEDVAVVGFDDMGAAAHTSPSLTTVRQPFYEMGRIAARLLLERMSGTPLPSQPVILPTELIVRGSSVMSAEPPV